MPLSFSVWSKRGILLAYYMQLIGQVIGASYYETGTLPLAMMLKLHQSPSPSVGVGPGDQPREVWKESKRGSADLCTFACGCGCAKYARFPPALDWERSGGKGTCILGGVCARSVIHCGGSRTLSATHDGREYDDGAMARW